MNERVAFPTLVSFFNDKPVASVACGDSHTMVLLKSGELFGFGKAAAVGTDSDPKKPVKITTALVSQVFCSGSYTFFNTASGELLAFGDRKGTEFQIMHTHPLKPGNMPEKVALPCAHSKVRKVVCTLYTMFLWTTSNEIYAYGLGKHGTMGIGHEDNIVCWRLMHVPTGLNDIIAGPRNVLMISK